MTKPPSALNRMCSFALAHALTHALIGILSASLLFTPIAYARTNTGAFFGTFDSVPGDHQLINSQAGTINTTAAFLNGMLYTQPFGIIQNDGTITGNNPTSDFIGINVNLNAVVPAVDTDITIKNYGIIKLNGRSPMGINFAPTSTGDAIFNVTNAGLIDVTGISGNSFGINVSTGGSGTIQTTIANSGTIKVNGFDVIGINAQSDTVTNTGTINVIGSNSAYGITMMGGTLNQPGWIYTSGVGANKAEVDIQGDVNVRTYATTLRDYTNSKVFKVTSGTLNFNNTTFIARPGLASEGFEVGKIYNVSDMITTAGHVNAVTGAIASATTDIDLLRATLMGINAQNQTISLAYNVNNQTIPFLQSAINNLNTLLNGNDRLAIQQFLQNVNNKKLVANATDAALIESIRNGTLLQNNPDVLVGVNLSSANLTYADLSGRNLNSVLFNWVNLSYANLGSANLSYASLFMADLSSANLSSANLSHVNLSEANLSYANLSSANLSGADLSYADLSGAYMTIDNATYTFSGTQGNTLIFTAPNGAKHSINVANANNVIGGTSINSGSDMLATNQANSINQVASQIAPQWSVYISPYGSANSADTSNGSSFGLSGGISRIFNEKFTVGMHFDVNRSFSNIDSFNTDSEVWTTSLGLNANYNINENWYVNAQITGAISQTYSSYETGSLALFQASDNYSGYSFTTGLNTGYLFEINENNIISPEIGISYVFQHTDSNAVEWNNNGSYMNIYNDSTDYAALYGTFNLRWAGQFELDNNSILKPFVSVGIRQNLTGNAMKSGMTFMDTQFITESTPDLTTFITSVGLEWIYGDFSVKVNYNGAFGSDNQNHGGSLNFNWSF